MHWGAVVVLLFAVIIVAIVIQAFDFENLRFWEGYLRSRPLRWWGALRIRAFQKKLTRLTQAFDEQRLSAFDDARRRALDDSTTKPSEQAM